MDIFLNPMLGEDVLSNSSRSQIGSKITINIYSELVRPGIFLESQARFTEITLHAHK